MQVEKVRRPTREARRAASMEAVLDAAQQLFVTQGYRGTTVEQVAARAGLTKGAVFFYFSDKATLLLALLDRVERRVYEPLFAGLREPGRSAQENLVAFLHRQSVAGGENAEMLTLPVVVSTEFDPADEPIGPRIRNLYDRIYDAVEAIVAEGQRSGEFHTHAPPREQASVIIAVHDGMLLEQVRRGGQLDGFGLVRALRMTIVAGLGAAA